MHEFDPVISRPEPVVVAFAGPAPQRRLTVAFRLLLLVPHLVVLFALGIATYVVVVVGWFAALVLGRLPDGMAGFLSGAVRYGTRVYSYGYLLTDVYPPFALGEADYPVAVITHPGRLNRVAVLFRLILMVPAYIVVALVGSGLGVALFFIWLIVLVAGRMPGSLHQAVAAVLRYQSRFYAFVGLVSAAYPGGLLGDQPTTVFAENAMLPGSPPAPAEVTGGGDPSWSIPAVLTPPPLATRLVLTTAARRIVILFLVLGVLTTAGTGAVDAVTIGSSLSNASLRLDLASDYSQLAQQVNTFGAVVKSCEQKGDLACAQREAGTLVPSFSTFADQVRGLSFPASDEADAARLATQSSDLAGVLNRMASAPTATAYISATRDFQAGANAFDQDYQTLSQDLLI